MTARVRDGLHTVVASCAGQGAPEQGLLLDALAGESA